MVKKLIFSFVFLVLLLSVISAMDTEIKVKTTPHKEVQVAVLSSGTGSSTLLRHFKNNSDQFGNVIYTYTGSQDIFDIMIYIKNPYNDENLMSPKRMMINAGEDVYVEMFPEGYIIINDSEIEELSFEYNESEEVIEEAENESNEIEETEIAEKESVEIEETEADEGATGNPRAFLVISGHTIIGDEGMLNLKQTGYILIAIIVLGTALTMIVRTRNKIAEPKESKEERAKKEKEENIAKMKKKLIEDEEALIKLRDEN